MVHWIDAKGAHLLAPYLRFDRLRWMRFLPAFPSLRRAWAAPVWPETRGWRTPDELRTVAGVWRDPVAEEAAFRQQPLHDFTIKHAGPSNDSIAYGWRFLLPIAGRLLREQMRLMRVAAEQPHRCAASDDPADLTRRIRAEAARLGLSTIGFAAYDEKYTFVEHLGKHSHPTVIVCVLEQEWAATQTAPSIRAERSAFTGYVELTSRLTRLAEFIQQLGFEARPQSVGAEGVHIYYGVQAGLGQLGLNGQLLTPTAGSRARLAAMTTNAPVVLDAPVDYGIHAICDECKLCVRRCPVGAIPAKRSDYRGVTKAKIKTERCFPVVARAHGCAVCMKVCPVQRYGLEAVTEHLVETGEILGKGSDELEGYKWPDGHYYGPGEKPPSPGALVRPPGWTWPLESGADSVGPLNGDPA